MRVIIEGFPASGRALEAKVHREAFVAHRGNLEADDRAAPASFQAAR